MLLETLIIDYCLHLEYPNKQCPSYFPPHIPQSFIDCLSMKIVLPEIIEDLTYIKIVTTMLFRNSNVLDTYKLQVCCIFNLIIGFKKII